MSINLPHLKNDYAETCQEILRLKKLISDCDTAYTNYDLPAMPWEGNPSFAKGSPIYKAHLRRIEYLEEGLSSMKTLIEQLELNEKMKFQAIPEFEMEFSAFQALSTDDKLDFIAGRLFFSPPK